MEPISFDGRIRYWKPAKASGLAVADIPAEHTTALGGLRQRRVRGRMGGVDFQSNIMPAGGGRLALSVSKAMMRASAIEVGSDVEVEITAVD